MAQSSRLSSNLGNRGGMGKIADCMKQVLVRGEMSDVQFAVGRDYGAPRIFSAHRIIMSARSDVFYTMFYGSVPENCAAPIDISDILPDAFANVLSYIYTDAVPNLSDDNVFPTLNSADKYDLPLLVEKCVEFILNKLNLDNCLEILEKAVQHTCASPDIMERCLQLVDGSAETIWQSDRFSSIRPETLLIVLQRETLAADEATIYESIENWAAEACEEKKIDASAVNRREILGPALYLVRFPLMADAQLMDGPAKSELWDIFRCKHAAVKPALQFRREARQNDMRPEGVISITVPDVRKLEEDRTMSDPITVRKLAWRIHVMKRKTTGRGSFGLAYFLHCAGVPGSDSWRCQAKAELRLLPWNAETPPIKRPISHMFSKKENDWGFTNFIYMEDLMDPVQGYFNPSDFSLKLQVHLAAEPPQETE
ncbi:BTB/POZ domain-containing protein 3-like isoform X2 [Paramacrobiotus metropolitanus]|uniref:BTB/POZ domain-containing protein 3-like isoform X2 n=1 Tax=Paramacrobiotus metropolitanus TaxID=2943436 RepID=UPI0024457558|nr:BTB/POZ domain-containing protein 3-like isoform X2 [Paramacrobiotus metropolitanus]